MRYLLSFTPLICTQPQYTTTPLSCIVADHHATTQPTSFRFAQPSPSQCTTWTPISFIVADQHATTQPTSLLIRTPFAVASAQHGHPSRSLLTITIRDIHSYLDFALHRRRKCTTTGCLLFRCCQITTRDIYPDLPSISTTFAPVAVHNMDTHLVRRCRSPRELPFRSAQPSPRRCAVNCLSPLPLTSSIRCCCVIVVVVIMNFLF